MKIIKVQQTNKSEMDKQIDAGKIYLLMGYLGSGKTTFIRNLLQNKDSEKYAVIQNEFASGEMGIEQPLIMDQSGVPFSSFLQLPNGCICCSAKNDLIASIEYILANTAVRNIIVETNGLADPAQVHQYYISLLQSIKQFWFDQQMRINGYLHSVISIFSAQKFTTLIQQQLFEKQIVFANKALITFVDKSKGQQVGQLEDYIKQRNAQCHVEKKDENFNVVSFIKGTGLFDVKTLNDIDNYSQHQCSHQQCQHNNQAKHNHHHHGIQSVFIKGRTWLKSQKEIEMRVGELLWESGIKVLRIKGVYCLQNEQSVYQLQGVDDVFQVKQTKTSKQKYQSTSKILVITQQQQHQHNLQQTLTSLLAIQ